VDPTAKLEGAAAGSDVLPTVLPATANLLAPFAPTSSQSWLTINTVTNGVVSFAFSANRTGCNRTAQITLLGLSISVTQLPFPTLVGAQRVNQDVFQFSVTNPGRSTNFTVLSTTNLLVPLTDWTVLGTASNVGSGLYQFTDESATNHQRFYTIRSP